MVTERSSRFLPIGLLLVSFLMMVSPVISENISCNVTTEYLIIKNSKIVGCVDCPTCVAGLEPSVPCGTTVDDNTVLGKCLPCKDDTYSSRTDHKLCQKCKDLQCLKHEILKKNCTSTYDASHCTGRCEDGFIMNEEKSECKRIGEKPLPTSNTTRATPEESSEMEAWQIVVIVVVIVLVIFLVLGILAWRKKKDKKVNEDGVCPLPPRNPKDVLSGDNGSSSSTELLGRQEDCPENEAAYRPHCPETSGGYATSPPVGCSNHTSDSPNPDHGQVNLDFQVTAPKPAQLTSPAPAQSRFAAAQRQTPPVLNQSRPAHVAAARNHEQPISHHRFPDMMRFENWPKITYDEICQEIENSVAPGKNWDALASNLGYTVKEAREFKKKGNKTDALIHSWMMETQNNVPKFIGILNEMKMTALADYINERMDTLLRSQTNADPRFSV